MKVEIDERNHILRSLKGIGVKMAGEYEDSRHEDVDMIDEDVSGAQGSDILEIPLAAEGEAVTIDLNNDLADDPSELCVLLENEKCASEYWLAIGTAYARNGQTENAIEVVSKGLQGRLIC
jgi:hypothetical protein